MMGLLGFLCIVIYLGIFLVRAVWEVFLLALETYWILLRRCSFVCISASREIELHCCSHWFTERVMAEYYCMERRSNFLL
jgi:hypothetical protein